MIFYFSGTGNTRWVASEIAKAINEELFYIPDLIREEPMVSALVSAFPLTAGRCRELSGSSSND